MCKELCSRTGAAIASPLLTPAPPWLTDMAAEVRALEPLGAGGGMIAVDPFMTVTAQSGGGGGVFEVEREGASGLFSFYSKFAVLAGWLAEADFIHGAAG